MNETTRTLTFGIVAIVLALLALVTAPKRVTPDAFSDIGDPFFPEFTDPNVATTLEVIDFDEETAAAKPFKVTNQNGIWTIPSHHDYPADGKDLLAKTAAGIIAIRKDDFRSDNVADHESCGVGDPLDDATTALKGRGKRVTIRGANDKLLADLIIGNAIEGREGFHFVRVPGQKRVYAAKIDVDISTKFADWIEQDLLEVTRADVDQVTIKDYSIDERTSRVDIRDELTLTKEGTKWTAEGLGEEEEVNTIKVGSLVGALDNLEIVGVRPKPPGLSDRLGRLDQISQSDIRSLQNKGYYFTRDGQLLSNEGELQARSSKGVQYTLRFGEILYGEGEAISSGTKGKDTQTGPGENRYLFVSVDFVEDLFPEPEKPTNTDFQGKAEEDLTDEDHKNQSLNAVYQKWEKEVEEGRKLAQRLNERFGAWYYVIAEDSFDKMHLNRSDVIRKKTS